MWNKVLTARGAQESWLIPKDHLLQAQAMQPNEEEIKQKSQEAYMDEQRDLGQTQIKGDLQRVKARTGSLGVM